MTAIARRHAAAGRRGFTLVEVLASMALVAIILPVAMKGVSLALQAAALARQRSIAASLAQTELDDLIAADDWSSPSMEGDFPDNPGYRWTADLTERESTTLLQVEVSVLWQSVDGRERFVTLDTLVYTEGRQP
jgi:type II secretion system protein I